MEVNPQGRDVHCGAKRGCQTLHCPDEDPMKGRPEASILWLSQLADKHTLPLRAFTTKQSLVCQIFPHSQQHGRKKERNGALPLNKGRLTHEEALLVANRLSRKGFTELRTQHEAAMSVPLQPTAALYLFSPPHHYGFSQYNGQILSWKQSLLAALRVPVF